MARGKRNSKNQVVVTERKQVIQEGTPPGRRATRNRPNGSRSRGGGGVGFGGFDITENVVAPVAIGRHLGKSRPSFQAKGDSGLIYGGTELLQTIQTSEAFSAIVVNLMPHSFPWIADMASLFANWRWLGLRFIYVPTCPTSTTGEISMCYQYDIPDPTPTSMSQMTNMHGYTNSAVWNGGEGTTLLRSINVPAHDRAVVSKFDTNRFNGKLFKYITAGNFLNVVNENAVLGPVAGNIYSPGNLVVGTVGGPVSNVRAGNIYVQYKIELIHPTPKVLNY